MPNLLKSLPQEILDNEDSKFIYNVLNPLLFEKVRDVNIDQRKSFTVSESMHHEIDSENIFNDKYTLPININFRELHVYMTDEQEKIKLERYGSTELIEDLNDIKSYIFFYFGVDGYNFLEKLLKNYYIVKTEMEKNKKLYEIDYKKFVDAVDIKKKKIYKKTYEHFKNEYLTYKDLFDEFELVFNELNRSSDFSIVQIIDNIAISIGNKLKIKSFDNEIIFENSKLFSFVTDLFGEIKQIDHFVFSGKKIVSSTMHNIDNVFELFAIFAMEISTIKTKYESYLEILNNNGYGFSLKKSETKMLKNKKLSNINVDLTSDNLTYFLNESDNKLEIYLYFSRNIRIDESTLSCVINDITYKKSIISLNGHINAGYDIMHYMDDTTRYYKITIHEYLLKDTSNEYINYNVESINLSFDAIEDNIQEIKNPLSPIVEHTGFIDNFKIYKKNNAGFFEELKIPFNVQVDIVEKDERFIREYLFKGINAFAESQILESEELLISFLNYDYVYYPEIYVDYFKYASYNIDIRFNTLIQYVLIDDIKDKNYTLNYYAELGIDEVNSNISKNVLMMDNKVYKKLFDEYAQMIILNPYNEINLEFIPRLTYGQFQERTDVGINYIEGLIEKIPFRNNLRFLEKMQYDKDRDCLIFMHLNKQFILPLNENLNRGLNYEKISFDPIKEIISYDGEELCGDDFLFLFDGIYVNDSRHATVHKLELVSTEQINIGHIENIIFFDMFHMSHAIIINGVEYILKDLYLATSNDVLSRNDSILYIDSNFGIMRYKHNNTIIDLDINSPILVDETPYDGALIFDKTHNELVYRNTITEVIKIKLEEVTDARTYSRSAGLTGFSLFYAGNALPENSNKTFYGRENIYNSMLISENAYNIGRSEDIYNSSKQNELLAEQLDLNLESYRGHDMEQEPFIMFKTSTASLKGLETYLKSNLKSISKDIAVSPVYLVQRNRFISEWARVSSILPTTKFLEAPLRDLVADLMETKLIKHNYDDLIDVFKNNNYENFSLDTNNINGILLQYLITSIDENYMIDELNYYMLYNVWLTNNRKNIIDFIKNNSDDSIIEEISNMTFTSNFENERLFYIFVSLLEQNAITIETYKPIANYSDWEDIEENNSVRFEKPFMYSIIDVSNFISMPLDWNKPLYFIRPLADDGVLVTKDYRPIDLTMITHSEVKGDDAYNEYEQDIKFKLNSSIDYLHSTLEVLQDLSIENNFDLFKINLVVVKWIVERFLPNHILNNAVENLDEFKSLIKGELSSAEHPNLIISYNKIKESTLLGDLGNNITAIYNNIMDIGLVQNGSIVLNIDDAEKLAEMDKIKMPVEHYFDFLFHSKRYDIISKVLALFTEDVIATSMMDLSMAINIKESKGDETYEIYEKMVFDLFDEFLPFHSILDKIIFTIKIMESSSSDSIGKQADVALEETNLIDIFSNFVEKVRIQTLDKSLISFKVSALFPSEGLKNYFGYDDMPYDYDRLIKPAGHDIYEMDADEYAVDDEWYVMKKSKWLERSEDVYTPPYFPNLDIGCVPESDFEKIADVFITDYFHIKEEIFNNDNRVESHFIDFIPTVNIEESSKEINDIDVIENYLIDIDTEFNIRFYDMENIPMDLYGLDEYAGPEDQTTLVGMYDSIRQDIMHDFYEKLNVNVLDSVWTEIKIIYDMIDIPGHDEFAVDEYYHQRGPDTLGQDMSVMIYDELLHQGFGITATDMSDVSLIDNKISTNIASEIFEKPQIKIADTTSITVSIWPGRQKGVLTTDSGIFIPGQDDFGIDEYFHDSADLDRLANMVDSTLIDALGIVRIDFGFMRMLPIDPYKDLIDQKFYRVNQPGSESNTARVRDSIITDIRIFGKDYLRLTMLDFYTLDVIDYELRQSIYDNIERNELGGEVFASRLDDTLIQREIHHDFRENIVALEKYAGVLDDSKILEIFGYRAANIERDELFELRLGDSHTTDIKIKQPVDRTMTKFDKDYLKSIKIEEDDLVLFKYSEKTLKVRLQENLETYYKFVETNSIELDEKASTFISDNFKETSIQSKLLEKLYYGHNTTCEMENTFVYSLDTITQLSENKIYTDSMIVSLTEYSESTSKIDYEFGDERTLQPHDEYGQMGYTDESIERSIDTHMRDNLLSLSEEFMKESVYTEILDSSMSTVGYYFGDMINVIISDSLNSYVDIVRQPWVFETFDEFGHNEGFHMYNGASDEFDITTQLKDRIKIDAEVLLYNSGALVQSIDRIYIGEHVLSTKDELNVSLVDDLKIVSLGFKESINVISTDIHDYDRRAYDTTSVNVSDKVWYGYKLRDDMSTVLLDDNIQYRYLENNKDHIDSANIRTTDWLLTSYFFTDGNSVSTNDKIFDIKEHLILNDKIGITLKDTLEIYKSKELKFSDASNIVINDGLKQYNEITVENPIEMTNDKIGASISDKLIYGEGKWFKDKLRGYVLNRMSLYEEKVGNQNINVSFIERFTYDSIGKPLYDSMNVSTYERLKYGLIFKDEKINVSAFRDNYLEIEYGWYIDRYGVDFFSHTTDDLEQEYYNDSVENSITTQIFEDVKIVDKHSFKDSIDFKLTEKIETDTFMTPGTLTDYLTISNSDTVLYSIGLYDYVWDAQEWEKYGYNVPYENWNAAIPHDTIPYNELGYEENSDDLSQITTGVTDNLLYGFDHIFKETLNVRTNDDKIDIYEYRSLFNDSISTSVLENLKTSYINYDDKNLKAILKEEQLKMIYEENGIESKHEYYFTGNISERIENIDLTTQELINEIFKYRFYEKLDIEINNNIILTSLFRFDDEMSLVTDFKTKIDLYKEESDGSVSKSMTLIKDKTSSQINLFFGDYMDIVAIDTIQGTYADKPNEYM